MRLPGVFVISESNHALFGEFRAWQLACVEKGLCPHRRCWRFRDHEGPHGHGAHPHPGARPWIAFERDGVFWFRYSSVVDPTGPCSFCEERATRWCRSYAVCPSADCNAAEFFHVERLEQGSVDTPEARAETRRYAVHRLASHEHVKREGSCAFCSSPAESQHPDCLVATCGTHERAGWRLTHRLALGGVNDTPELREEVLRHVAASDRFLEEGKREETGARRMGDYESYYGDVGTPYPQTVAGMRPPPEEIPLAGATPHYEWP